MTVEDIDCSDILLDEKKYGNILIYDFYGFKTIAY